MPLPVELLDLLHKPAICFLTTLMPDGTPQITQVWVDTDGEHVVINSVTTHQKVRNIHRDPHVAVAIADPENPAHYWAVRGRVTATTTEGADDHINDLSYKYLGKPYPAFGSGQRIILTITADSTHAPRR